MKYQPASTLTDDEIISRIKYLEKKWDDLRALLEESGGSSGSPGEWIVEELGELETEQKRRKSE